MRDTVLVVPCFNEAGRLDVEAFVAAAERGAVGYVFVDDGSTDATAEMLEGLRRRLSVDVATVLTLPANVGKAEAVRQGVRAVLERPPGERSAVGYWDADLATPLGEVGRFRQLLDKNPQIEAVFGSRIRMLGTRIDRRTLRHYPGRIFATFASMAVGLPVYDSQCGAKLFRCSETTAEAFGRPFATRWTFDVEILARIAASRAGATAEVPVVECPLREWRDVGGSKVRPAHLPGMLADLWRIYREYGRGSGPASVRSTN